MTPRLPPEARAEALAPLSATGWTEVPGQDAIRKILKFKNFSEAWGFMTRCALAAARVK